MATGETWGYVPTMDDAHHQALVAERSRLARTFLELRQGDPANGATAEPEVLRHLADEIARLTALIAKSRSDG